MPKYRVRISLHSLHTDEDRIVEAASQHEAISQIMGRSPIVYDKRYWGIEIFAYSVNGEDF